MRPHPRSSRDHLRRALTLLTLAAIVKLNSARAKTKGPDLSIRALIRAARSSLAVTSRRRLRALAAPLAFVPLRYLSSVCSGYPASLAERADAHTMRTAHASRNPLSLTGSIELYVGARIRSLSPCSPLPSLASPLPLTLPRERNALKSIGAHVAPKP